LGEAKGGEGGNVQGHERTSATTNQREEKREKNPRWGRVISGTADRIIKSRRETNGNLGGNHEWPTIQATRGVEGREKDGTWQTSQKEAALTAQSRLRKKIFGSDGERE